MMNSVMKRPLFRQSGSPMTGERSAELRQLIEDIKANEGMRGIIGNKEADNVSRQLGDLMRRPFEEFKGKYVRNPMSGEMEPMSGPLTGDPKKEPLIIMDRVAVRDKRPNSPTFNEIIQLPRNMETYEMIKSGMFDLQEEIMGMGDSRIDEMGRPISEKSIFEVLRNASPIGNALQVREELTGNRGLLDSVGDIYKRITSKAEGGEMETDAVGIASGLDEEESMEQGPMTVDRGPSEEGIAKVSPEQYVQLMNEIRGDDVPMEGRVQELAGVVGEKDATDTPLSVLALVQPVFELQEQQGIGATQQAQDMMPPMASDQLANPQNMGIVRAQSGLIVDSKDSPFVFQNIPRTSIQGDPTFAGAMTPSTTSLTSTPTPDYMDMSNTLISDFMKQYVSPVKMDASSLQNEIDLLKGVYGDSKKEAQRALALTGIQRGLELASGADINQLISQTAGDIYKITNAVTQQDKAIALQAYKTLLDRKSSMSEREFNLAKMGLENQLKILFEQSKGMEKPIYLKDPKTGSVVVLDQTKDATKIRDLLDANFEPVSTTAQQPLIQQTFSTVDMKDGGIVKRANGSSSMGETTAGGVTYEEAMEGIEEGSMGLQKSELVGKGGMELVRDPGMITKYQNRIISGVELEKLLNEAIGMIENNPKLAGLVGDVIQVAQKGVLPINQLFELFGGTSPIPPKVTEFLSDPDVQDLANLETLIPEKLVNFVKDIDVTRMPAFNRIADQKANLRISGFSDATVATNTLKSILQNVQEANNQLREAIGRPEVGYGSALSQILQQFDVTEDNELVKQAIDAIKQQPQFQEQILDSLLNKLKQQSGS
jgi:hypothetical protein